MSADGALIIPIPAAEQVVADVRARLGLEGELELPTHVSVLYPFAPPPYEQATIDALDHVFQSVESFRVAFRRVDRFERRVIYLAPDPAEPFSRLTRAVEAQFPQHLAYGGAFASIVPHLTVVEDASKRVMRRAARALQAVVPLHGFASSVSLVGREAGNATWTTYREFALAERRTEGRRGAP